MQTLGLTVGYDALRNLRKTFGKETVERLESFVTERDHIILCGDNFDISVSVCLSLTILPSHFFFFFHKEKISQKLIERENLAKRTPTVMSSMWQSLLL